MMYYLACESHREVCEAARKGDSGHVYPGADTTLLVPSFVVAHKDCVLKIVCENVAMYSGYLEWDWENMEELLTSKEGDPS